jgi:hypothetical protein
MSTEQELEAWLGQGINVELHEPSSDNPRYTAFAEEFAMTGQGDTLGGAIAALFSNLRAYVESFANAGQPLPPRTPGILNEDERADQMNGR